MNINTSPGSFLSLLLRMVVFLLKSQICNGFTSIFHYAQVRLKQGFESI